MAVISGSIHNGIFKSPAGASYGSFTTKNLSFTDYEELIDTFVNYAKEKKYKELLLTPSPITYMQQPNQIESFLLSYKGFSVKHHLISNVVDLNRSLEKITNNFTTMHKKSDQKSNQRRGNYFSKQ